MHHVSTSLDQAKTPTRGNEIIQRLLYPLSGLALGAAGFVVHAESNHPFSVPNRSSGPFLESALNLAGTHWERTAHHHHLDPYLLYAIALVESSRIDEGLASPWPWALNKAGKPLYPKTFDEALGHLTKSIDRGESNIDVGLMQVNYRWHFERAGSLTSLMDPVKNVDLGAQILSEAIASVPGNLTLGVGRYHAWQDRAEALQYGERVLKLSSRLRQTAGRK
jgi:hypothetical protein